MTPSTPVVTDLKSSLEVCESPPRFKNSKRAEGEEPTAEEKGVDSKRPRLAKTMPSVGDLVASTREVSSLDREHGAVDLEAENNTSCPWRRVLDVSGFKTEIYGVHHTTTGGRRTYMIQVERQVTITVTAQLELKGMESIELTGSMDVDVLGPAIMDVPDARRQ